MFRLFVTDSSLRQQPSRGRWLPLSRTRRLVGDLLHFAHQIPTIPVQKHMGLGRLVLARTRLEARPSWVALFVKAYGLVCMEMPALRRAYLRFPWPHLYEHPETICSVAVERVVDGEEGVLFGRLRTPEARTLTELTNKLVHYKEDPVESIGCFRLALRWMRVPAILHRPAWWWGLNGSGWLRARLFGTFGISVYSGLGVESLHPISPLTTVLNYGPIAADGAVAVRIVYDHRVLDGSTVGRALVRLEEVLTGPILSELDALHCESRGALSA
jgi:hypothetical protein